MAVVRVREHVNPLSIRYRQPTPPPDWTRCYGDLARPLHLDIGSGKGHFLLAMADREPGWNFLGLEIREPLVDRANDWRRDRGLDNLHYLFCNANASLRALLASLPPGCVRRVSVQFPDPWFKKRHQKRRVVQPALVDALAEFLPSGATVFLQSDVEAVAAEMRDRVLDCPAFRRAALAPETTDPAGWLRENPFPVATERELAVASRGEPAFRVLLERV